MKKVGLALGAGGSLGLSHIGVLETFEKNKIPIDFISGSSIGAIVAAHYALYKDLGKLNEDAVSFIKENNLKVFGIETVMQKTIILKKIKYFFESTFGNKKFSDCKIPLAITAVDVESGKVVILNKGLIKDAILASMSIPIVFSPTFYWGKWLVDGGLFQPVPIEILRKNKCDVLIGVDLYPYTKKTYKKEPTTIQMIYRTLYLIQCEITRLTLKNENAIIISPQYTLFKDEFSLDTAKSYILAGKKGAKKQLNKIKKELGIL
jgi:NTE family protein